MGGIVPVTAEADEVPVDCVSVVDDTATAVDVAAACGAEVEI